MIFLLVIAENMLLIGGLVIAANSDLRFRIISNKLIIALFVIKLIDIMLSIVIFKDVRSIEIMIEGMIMFPIIVFFYVLCKGGFGAGDGKLIGVVGCYIGLEALLSCLLITFIIMFLVGAILLRKRVIQKHDRIPMAPFLFLGVIMVI